MQFNRAYCNYAICGPSRASFLTGLLPENIGVMQNNVPIQSVIGDRVSLPALFKMNGYETINVGKIFHKMRWDIEPFDDEYNDVKAWDQIYHYETTEIGKTGEGRNLTDSVLQWCYWLSAKGTDEDQQDGLQTAKAVELIKKDRDKPFFLAIGLHKPHDPFVAPQKYFDLYSNEECTPPRVPEGWEQPYPFTFGGWTEQFNKFSDQDKREFLRAYFAATSFVDAQVGKLVAALEETGQRDNTLIVLFGDHGYHLGEHNWWNKVTLFELGTRAPFIISGPAVKNPGAQSNAFVEFIDIYPTLADIFGLNDIPDNLDGQSFSSLLERPYNSFRSEVRAVTKRGPFLGRMVRNENYRYVEWDDGKRGAELYELKNDPIEYNNLADSAAYQQVIQDMKSLLAYPQ